MSDNPKFGSPALSNELDKACGSTDNQEKVSLRESDDVSEFLMRVEKSEKESENIELQFS